MPHNNHTLDRTNKDWQTSRTAWLRVTADCGWVDPLPPPRVESFKVDHRTFHVVQEGYVEGGTKSRLGDLLVRNAPTQKIVYVQPRFGFAGMAISRLCRLYGKELHLFCPACKEISQHQAWCLSLGAKLHFYRIAAMPNLNKVAEQWANENDATFVPLGLRHWMATAVGVRVCDSMMKAGYNPRTIWAAVSTGVLVRALQIGFQWSDTKGVAVARNLKDGEIGPVKELFSAPERFADPAKELPPWPSVANYDAKVWQFMKQYGQDGDFMWNVAADVPEIPIPAVNCNVPWGVMG